MKTMELCCFFDGTNTVIAEDPTDATAAWCEHMGGEPEDHQDEHGDWEVLLPRYRFSIWCDNEGDPCEPDSDGSEEVTKTAAEWIASQGRGFLCSTEF